jgi:hypothetical protein
MPGSEAQSQRPRSLRVMERAMLTRLVPNSRVLVVGGKTELSSTPNRKFLFDSDNMIRLTQANAALALLALYSSFLVGTIKFNADSFNKISSREIYYWSKRTKLSTNLKPLRQRWS